MMPDFATSKPAVRKVANFSHAIIALSLTMAATMTATHSTDAQKKGHVLANGVNYYY